MSQGHDETESRESNFGLQKSSAELSNEMKSSDFFNGETGFTRGAEDNALVWVLHIDIWFLRSSVIFQILTKENKDMQHDKQLSISELASRMYGNSSECC